MYCNRNFQILNNLNVLQLRTERYICLHMKRIQYRRISKFKTTGIHTQVPLG